MAIDSLQVAMERLISSPIYFRLNISLSFSFYNYLQMKIKNDLFN